MGSALSRRCGSRLSSILPRRPSSGRRGEKETRAERDDDDDDDTLDGLVRSEDMAKFPYVEFTGRDSITCPACQGSGRIPSEQVNELVALIPYTDQRLQPQRTKLYVVLSAVLCFLASVLVAFFLFPRSVIVVDDGISVVTVHFDPPSYKVQMNLTSTLNFSNPNFFSVLVQSVSCQVLYMKKVIGTHHLNNVTTVLPLSERQVNYTVSVEIGSSAAYVFAFCTMRSIKVHNIVVFMQTSVKTSHMVRTSQNSLEAYHYVNCGSNTTYQHWHHFSAHSHLS
ncbi:transmembrane protein 106C [Phycodurus eques]|uniref:transmembrane protein 106C n=1 Tax=Phycodurus eques TaxID=693459 RepID=UPI002ACD6408|nr:transmembrane protein 106C [Phycodurus eques]XP_061536898.1 transmembrane protein 106C [Phycodurus eques]XP_061536909.1 transmembrane protein 106C [Phycodurus eques]